MIPHIPTQPKSPRGGSKTLLLSVASILLAAGYADAANYRYYRFTPTQLGSGTAVQISEFDFTKAGVRLAYPTGTTVVSTAGTDGGTADANGVKSEGAIKVIDGLTSTKWYNGGANGLPAAIVFDVGAGDPTKTLDIDGYRFATANDSSNRNPVAWKLEGSTDNTNWVSLDVRSGYTYTTATQFLTYTPIFTLPAVIPPTFSTFNLYNPIVKNGSTSAFDYSADNSTSVTLNPSNGSTLDPSFGSSIIVDPPDNKDTAYTLTAASTQTTTTATKTFTLRSVAGGSSTYRYVRFTPIKTAAQIQIADITFFNGDTPLAATSNLEGATAADTATEGPHNLADQNPTTKWFSATLVPVVFDFTTSQSFDNYTITGAADSATYPGRNPTQWIMEGSDGATGPWTLIENVTAFDYPFPSVNGASIDVPLPGASLTPIITKFSSFRDAMNPGSATWITYAAGGAGRLTLQAGNGAETDLPQDQVTVDVNPTAPTTYTIRAYSADNAASKTVVKTLTLDAPTTTIPATINYVNGFANASDVDFSLLGNTAGFVNDVFDVPLPGDVTRLRLVPDVGGVQGYAWFRNKVAISGGFDTTFYAQPTTLSRGYGAEGMAFVIQNTAEGLLSQPNPAEKGPTSNAYTIELSAWDNNAVAPATLNEARVRVIQGKAGQSTLINNVNLYDFPAITPYLSVSGFPSLTGNYKAAPYKVRVTYSSGKLNVWFNDTQVLTDAAADLSDAVDSSGKAYVGFTARNGGWTENADITSWVFTSNTVTPPTNDLKILSSSFDFTASSLTLNFASNSGTTYKVTHSATLNGTDWIQVGSNVTASGATSTATVPFTKGTKDFFRVEVAQ